MFSQLLESFITTNTTWYIWISLSLSPQSPRSRTYQWQSDVSDMVTAVLKATSSSKESSEPVLPLLESSWRESSSNLKYFDSSLRRSSSCINKYQVKLPSHTLRNPQYLKIIRENQRAVPEKVQDKSEKNSIAVYENSSFGVAEKRVWILCEPLC